MNIFKWLFSAITMFPRDINFSMSYLSIVTRINYWSYKGWTIHQVFDNVATKYSNKVAIEMQETTWTFKRLQDYSLKVANHFKEDLQKDHVVAIFMENKPEYIGLWLGLTRLGVICALINTSQKKEALKHSIATVNSKMIICDTELIPAINDLQGSSSKLDESVKLYTLGPLTDKTLDKSINLDPLIEKAPLTRLDPSIPKKLNIDSSMLYIYTSGTSGLPKAAKMTYRRFAFLSTDMHTLLKINPEKDVVYTPMTLYHASGGMLGPGQMLLFGTSLVLRQKFSASNYISDCRKYGVTVGQYIGEMCSHMLKVKPADNDKDHKIRLMFGNGLGSQIWQEFKDRFGIKQIAEFYGSTEGNANLINTVNKPGSMGFMPWFGNLVYPMYLIEYDADTQEPIRDKKTGRCKTVPNGTPGILIGAIKARSATSSFDGYTDKEATEKKILKDVFKKNDLYFNTGDLIKKDDYGYYYFVDRLGDTYRWKGENVATKEVENIVSKNLGIADNDVTVYGVAIPGANGKAGMMAFAIPKETLKLDQLSKVVKGHMAHFQIPLFVRMTSGFPRTSTEKVKKAEMQKEGFDPSKVSDPLYFYKDGAYTELTPQLFEQIVKGQIRY